MVSGQAGWGGVEFIGEEFEGAGDAWAVGPVQGDGDLPGAVVDLPASISLLVGPSMYTRPNGCY